jgi:NAD-dependent deacetylase
MSEGNIQTFKAVLEQSTKIVGFTGAGISTESGISDYRSKGGIWDRFKPVYFDEFLKDEAKRLLYWQRKKELWEELKDAKPNRTHLFFKELYDSGRLIGIITQNIDGLHEKSGIPDDKIVNLHGTNLEVACLDCGFIEPSEKVFNGLDLSKGVPLCPKCSGLVKPNTISFGQSLRQKDLENARALALSCDMMIACGSTLIVQPAASFPYMAKNNGAFLAILTQSDTHLDAMADFVSHQRLSDFWDAVLVR